jgi:hypothetical protein
MKPWAHPRAVNTDKAPAYRSAVAELKAEGKCPPDTVCSRKDRGIWRIALRCNPQSAYNRQQKLWVFQYALGLSVSPNLISR